MPTAADIAQILDEEMLGEHGVTILGSPVPTTSLSKCTNLANEVGDRLLIKYIREGEHLRYNPSAPFRMLGPQYVTLTPFDRDEAASRLNMPSFLSGPMYLVLLEPSKVEAWGPKRVRGGTGIEYVLVNGFDSSAIVPPGWPIRVA